jgi:hypothetical protein
LDRAIEVGASFRSFTAIDTVWRLIVPLESVAVTTTDAVDAASKSNDLSTFRRSWFLSTMKRSSETVKLRATPDGAAAKTRSATTAPRRASLTSTDFGS